MKTSTLKATMPAPAVDPLAPGQMAQPANPPAVSNPKVTKGKLGGMKKKPITSLGELKSRIASKFPKKEM